MDINSFKSSSRYSLFFRSRHDRQPIRSQFNNIYSPEAAPYQIVSPLILQETGIDRVLYTNLIATKHLTMIRKRSLRRVGRSYPNSARLFSSPHRHCIIKHIFTVNIINVRCPNSSFRFKPRTSFIRECSVAIRPFHQIFRLHDRNVSGRFGSIHIKITICSFNHRRVGHGNIYNRILITHRRLCLCSPLRKTSTYHEYENEQIYILFHQIIPLKAPFYLIFIAIN